MNTRRLTAPIVFAAALLACNTGFAAPVICPDEVAAHSPGQWEVDFHGTVIRVVFTRALGPNPSGNIVRCDREVGSMMMITSKFCKLDPGGGRLYGRIRTKNAEIVSCQMPVNGKPKTNDHSCMVSCE
jgi:hypothetical protein